MKVRLWRLMTSNKTDDVKDDSDEDNDNSIDPFYINYRNYVTTYVIKNNSNDRNSRNGNIEEKCGKEKV